jgi:hypothetical protein
VALSALAPSDHSTERGPAVILVLLSQNADDSWRFTILTALGYLYTIASE